MHFMGWKLGLKTGMYYLRTKPAAAAIKFTVDKEKTPVSRENSHKFCDIIVQQYQFYLLISNFKVAAANKENEMPPVADIKLEVKSGEVPTEEDIRKLNEAALVCSLENKEACMMCSS